MHRSLPDSEACLRQARNYLPTCRFLPCPLKALPLTPIAGAAMKYLPGNFTDSAHRFEHHVQYSLEEKRKDEQVERKIQRSKITPCIMVN
eukprot:1154568-Pelagomonas_calceolata.AAC.9